MNIWKWLAGLTAVVFLSSWCVSAQRAEPTDSNPESDLLVSGVVVPITDEPYVYQGETVFTEEAHAVVTLTHVYDGSNALSLTRRIPRIEGFPIPFRIEGSAEGFFDRPGGSYPMNYYVISATVYMGAGDKIYIGDFMTDILFQVDGPTSDMKIRVTGLEACNSPNGGGACVENRRP